IATDSCIAHARITRGSLPTPIAMHWLLLLLLGFAAFFWVVQALRVAWGLLQLPWMKDFAPAKHEDCPRISLLFAARDEEEKLRQALATLAKIDYPHLEIVAVDDRSRDATARILDEFARRMAGFASLFWGGCLEDGWGSLTLCQGAMKFPAAGCCC